MTEPRRGHAEKLMSKKLTILCGLWCGLAALPLIGRESLVETVGGRTWQGPTRVTNNAVIVDGTNVVPLTDLRRLSFDVPPPTNAPGRGKGNGLLGYYFARTNFQGSVIVRLDERVDFDWATGEPVQGAPRDGFSVIWTGDIDVPVDGEYQFSVMADDMAELTISNQTIVAAGPARRGQEVTSPPLAMVSGTRYPVLLKFQDWAGAAAVRLSWQGPGLSRRPVPGDRLHAKSRLPEHASDPLSDEGLLATYYRNVDFSGETLTRVDPKIEFNWMDRDPVAGFSRSRYSVRWMGQLRADHSETYTIHVVADEPMRVWLDGRPLILPGGQYYMTEVRETVPLIAGESYDLRLEAQSTSGNASMKVMWSSPSTPKNVIPTTHLSPVTAVAGGGLATRPGRMPRGFLLADGSFVAVPVERATDTVLRSGRWLRNNPVSTVNVARIHCQPVSRAMVDRIPPGRAGLLLAKGDFVDGEFKSLEHGQVKLGSVLFGVKTYDANKDVLVVVLRDVRARPAEFEIALQDQSMLNVDTPRLEPSWLRFREPALGTCQVDWLEVVSLRKAERR